MVISTVAFSRVQPVTLISYTFKNEDNKILDVIVNSEYINGHNGINGGSDVVRRRQRQRQKQPVVRRRSGFNREARYGGIGGTREEKAKSWSPFAFDVVGFQYLDPFDHVRFYNGFMITRILHQIIMCSNKVRLVAG